MSNAAKYSASRVIGIDRMYETGESVLPKLQPLFKFVHSTNLTTFFSHLLGQFRTPDQVLVTPLARPFLASPIRDEPSADMEVNWDDSDEVDDLMDIAQFHDDGPLFCGLRMRWCHDPSQILFLWSCYLDNLDFNAALTLLNRVFLGVAASPFFLSWEGYRSSYDHPLSAEQEEAIRKVFPVICPFDVCWRTYYVKKLRLDTLFQFGNLCVSNVSWAVWHSAEFRRFKSWREAAILWKDKHTPLDSWGEVEDILPQLPQNTTFNLPPLEVELWRRTHSQVSKTLS